MNTEPKQYRTIGLKFKHITCAITCAISTVYWVVTGLVRTQRLQNSPPKISRRIARARSAPSALTLPAPPSGVSADSSSHGHAEGNLRRAPLTHHVCSKVMRVRLSPGLSDPGLRGRF